jgi:hypothetical protein
LSELYRWRVNYDGFGRELNVAFGWKFKRGYYFESKNEKRPRRINGLNGVYSLKRLIE